ncbi:hypothetical protein F9C05_00505 [Klebsiella pneumoniae]|nr:hypothetical protein F9C05_00505 [Klebsiella pneumoniae]QKI42889.1 hypothetical protein FVP31_00255 [Klebsiella pneumoniae]HBW8907500.1 hypothetical protein [Klebsiella pneumoniae]HBZ5508306.1 hypothetical protein [Klebsiella pneumoniae]
MLKERSRLALRLAGLRLRRPAGFHPQARASAAPPGGQAPYPRLCRMAAYMPYPAYRKSPSPQDRQAQRRRAVRPVPWWRHQFFISGLIGGRYAQASSSTAA